MRRVHGAATARDAVNAVPVHGRDADADAGADETLPVHGRDADADAGADDATQWRRRFKSRRAASAFSRCTPQRYSSGTASCPPTLCRRRRRGRNPLPCARKNDFARAFGTTLR